MSVEFEISTTFEATSPQAIYDAWLDSAAHTAMTGGSAEVSAVVGESFSAWDGYISGRNVELAPGARIVQSWRTVEFEAADPDSQLEITLQAAGSGTLLTLRHSNLPAHGTQYEPGWEESYFEPMRQHFG
jgi:activator of HSP90 ATPase